MDDREMYDEITALIGAVAKALETSETEVVTAIEQGRLEMELLTDAEGANYVAVACDGKSAHIYPGAIFRPGDEPDADTGGCGHGGCGCGH
ncbi:hypothetical protein [Magnetospirillum sp. UT-4]|uniref:hypothetical protein n=1 Tax=Magnetospirillum sp. UT-4 TaxID=2681467 RepID=UPI001385EF08|nr:hypothetical protein [Magnetospirillum sp. UT-4]CAA7618396.1 conserved hypothetical protein [Magnetospirillum sp. UT-4]